MRLPSPSSSPLLLLVLLLVVLVVALLAPSADARNAFGPRAHLRRRRSPLAPPPLVELQLQDATSTSRLAFSVPAPPTAECSVVLRRVDDGRSKGTKHYGRCVAKNEECPGLKLAKRGRRSTKVQVKACRSRDKPLCCISRDMQSYEVESSDLCEICAFLRASLFFPFALSFAL